MNQAEQDQILEKFFVIAQDYAIQYAKAMLDDHPNARTYLFKNIDDLNKDISTKNLEILDILEFSIETEKVVSDLLLLFKVKSGDQYSIDVESFERILSDTRNNLDKFSNIKDKYLNDLY